MFAQTSTQAAFDRRYSRLVTSRATVEVPCHDIASDTDRFVSLGWRIVDVYPADDPRRVTLDGHGVRLRLVCADAPRPHIVLDDVAVLGDSAAPDIAILPSVNSRPSLTSTFQMTTGDEAWHVGRAGMEYRDIVPDRQGGAVIASHIRIRTAGPVPDYPHHHDVLFQLIFCQRGWVRLAYEGQGDPFVLRAGECVTQPPHIRHRVLECSADLEVVEIGCPAEHLTIADHDFDFTTSEVDPARTWDGQRFVRYTHENATWEDVDSGIRQSDTGVDDATHSRADVRVIEMETNTSWALPRVGPDTFTMIYVLTGETQVTTSVSPTTHRILESGSLVVPVEHDARVVATTPARLLLVRVNVS